MAPASSDAIDYAGDPDEWRHVTARVNGTDMHYVTVEPPTEAVDHPTGTPPVVVLLHGFPEHWYAWRHQLSPLAEAGYRVVAPDMRGYNRSSAPAGVDSYSIDTLVTDVRELVGHLKAPTVDLVGHDWGGLVAWETAIREPDLLKRLAILNAPHPAAYRRALRRSPEQLLRSWYVFLAQVPWLPERLLEADGFRAVETMLSDTVEPDAFTPEEIDRYRAAMARSESVSGPINYYRAQARETLREDLQSLLPGQQRRDETINVPTLVIWGEQDRALSIELLDGLEEWVPDLTVRRLPTASHWVQADAPDRVTEELLTFLA